MNTQLQMAATAHADDPWQVLAVLPALVVVELGGASGIASEADEKHEAPPAPTPRARAGVPSARR